jgi:CubicO group peptidase (beta-lactamase class C family)
MRPVSVILFLVAAGVAPLIRPAASGASPLPGQLVIDPDNPQVLRRHGGAPVFICGPGDPEDFLYRGARQPDGTRRGDQQELIEKLARFGGNSVYLQAVRTHGGDAKDDLTHNPFVDSDPAKGLDPRILDQWEEWFALMDRHEILIYFEFYDDSAQIWRTGNSVSEPERHFFQSLVRRFKHHRNLIWIIGEESDERYTSARVRALAEVIRAADDHGHIIGNHHLGGTTFRAWAPGSALTHFSMQLNVPPDGVHAGALEARAKAAGRYQVFYAENTATPKTDDGMRRFAWAAAMAGVMPMMLQMDIAETSPDALAQCRALQRFFEASDFHRMLPQDDLREASTRYVLADAGRSYVAYTDAPGEIGVRTLPAGRCVITWLDCRTGQTAEMEHRLAAPAGRRFSRPPGFGDECAAWIRFPEIAPSPRKVIAAAPVASTATRANEGPVVRDLNVNTKINTATYVQLRFHDDDGPGPYRYTIVEPPQHGTLSGDDNDRTYTPAAGFTGRDHFAWQVHDGAAESKVARVTIQVGGDAAKAAPGGAYFPPSESKGGWRQLERADDIRRLGGAEPAKLAELDQWLRGSDQRNFDAVLIRHGYLVFEARRGNRAKLEPTRVASVSKAVAATVLAIAAERSKQGLTPHRMSFDDPAFRFLPWAQPLSDPRKAQVTVRQLLDHTSGICPEATGAPNDGTWDYVLGHTGDARTARLAFDPGAGCGYSTHAMHHVSLVCEYVTGQPYDQFAVEHLFRPIGCEHWWFQFFEGSEKAGRHPTHGLGMPARDLARIGYCMLRNGGWAGTQIIPRWFIDGIASSRAATGMKELRRGEDSAHFAEGWERPSWLTSPDAPGRGQIPADARYKRGSGGQFLGYVPSLDLVVARQTGGSGVWEYEEFLRRACLAVTEIHDTRP